MIFWTWLKDGCPKGFFKDEHSLLISYDMMPLRGLDETRAILSHDGEIATGHLIECEGEALFVPFKNGEPDIEAIDWGCSAREYDRCLRKLCFFVSFAPSDPHRNEFNISDKDNASLRNFHWRMLGRDKRRRRPLSRLKPIVEAILLSLGFQVKPVKFVTAV